MVFNGLTAQRMRECVYYTICDNGTPISNTLCYSIESYIAVQYESTQSALDQVMLMMIRYGDSATNYFQNK